jgi:cob(I)alamin adenosyltransferase
VKIYTKTGDLGQTSLIGGVRVPKHHLRIETYGTVDELNSYIGLLRDQLGTAAHTDLLIQIQNKLFVIGSLLAASSKNKMVLPTLNADDISALEQAIDALDAQLPPLKNFVLPGGHITVSHCHIARTVCRRTERLVVLLSEAEPIEVVILQYFNRLSDYLFVLARHLAQSLGATEVAWLP